jgi:hypothetical protein
VSMSLYYTAERKTPLTDAEQAEVNRLVAEYPWQKCIDPRPPVADDDLAVARHSDDDPESLRDQGNEEDLGEPFEFYPSGLPDPDDPDIILDGAVKPPTNPRDFVNAVNYWCELLAKVRVAVPGADWVVSLEDSEISWDDDHQCYYLDSGQDAPDTRPPVVLRLREDRP